MVLQVIYTDVALDPYSSDGHDGIVREDGENSHNIQAQSSRMLYYLFKFLFFCAHIDGTTFSPAITFKKQVPVRFKRGIRRSVEGNSSLERTFVQRIAVTL